MQGVCRKTGSGQTTGGSVTQCGQGTRPSAFWAGTRAISLSRYMGREREFQLEHLGSQGGNRKPDWSLGGRAESGLKG